jgi:hypothetical protein
MVKMHAKMHAGLHGKGLLLLSDFNKNCNVYSKSVKFPRIKFLETPFSGFQVAMCRRQTGRHGKTNKHIFTSLTANMSKIAERISKFSTVYAKFDKTVEDIPICRKRWKLHVDKMGDDKLTKEIL